MLNFNGGILDLFPPQNAIVPNKRLVWDSRASKMFQRHPGGFPSFSSHPGVERVVEPRHIPLSTWMSRWKLGSMVRISGL